MAQEQESAEKKLRAMYDKSEKQVSRSADELVGSQGFAEALAMLTSNVVAISRVMTIGLDQAVRATRLAGQRDIIRLGHQLNRTEDKLEQVLQVVEQLEEELTVTRAQRDEALRATEPVPARARRAGGNARVVRGTARSAAPVATGAAARRRPGSAPAATPPAVTTGEATTGEVPTGPTEESGR